MQVFKVKGDSFRKKYAKTGNIMYDSPKNKNLAVQAEFVSCIM